MPIAPIAAPKVPSATVDLLSSFSATANLHTIYQSFTLIKSKFEAYL